MSGGKQARSCSGHAVVAADNAQNRFQVAISNLSELLLGIEPQFYLIVATGRRLFESGSVRCCGRVDSRNMWCWGYVKIHMITTKQVTFLISCHCPGGDR